MEMPRPSIENLKVFKPEVIELETAGLVDVYAFRVVQAQILSNKNSVLTLPTGSTPLGMYQHLIEAYQKGLDMSGLITRNLDEYWPLTKNHPQSYDYFMRENFFNHVNIPESHRFIENCEATDPNEEVARYQELLRATGPSDLAILGIGPGLTCHIAFNERGSAVDSRTRLVTIDEDTIRANAKFFNNINEVPKQAMTQGVADILDAKKIILIAKGMGKAEGVKRTLEGPIGPEAPASFLRLHPNVVFIIDKEVGSLLSK